MNTEQERAAFEAWAKGHYILQRSAYNDTYIAVPTMRAWEVWQARAALQSQDHPNRQGRVMDKLFCDMKTDEEKAAFFLSGRGYETGVISQAIQNDVAMAYQRCAEYRKELEALQSQEREDAERYRRLRKGDIDDVAVVQGLGAMDYGASAVIATYSVEIDGDDLDAAIDRARRAEGDGE